MKRLFFATLFAALLIVPGLRAAGQPRTYDVISVDVPFNFKVGHQAFRAGHYQLVFVGNGLLRVRDEKERVLAQLVTKSRVGVAPPPTTQLVFDRHNKPAQLTEIWMENRPQVLEIVGEEWTGHRPTPPAAAPLQVDSRSFFGRSSAPVLMPR